MSTKKMEHKIYTLLALALCAALGACSDDSASDRGGDKTGADMSADMRVVERDQGEPAGDDLGAADMATAGDMPGADDMLDSFDLPDSPFMFNDMGQVLCGDKPCACSDGLDNDGDGVTDGFDAECTGPFDDDEASFATGIPGDNRDPVWQDCFFDGNSGAGDDGCRYKTGCLTGELEPTHRDCQLSQRCLDFCQPRTPNGCDCFGCCEVFKDDGSSLHIVIGGACSLEAIDDAGACPRCEPSAQCANPCGRCELCLGKEPGDLPADCSSTPQPADMGAPDDDMGSPSPDMGAPLPYTCDGGQQACSAEVRCPTDRTYYCYLGCCIEYAG